MSAAISDMDIAKNALKYDMRFLRLPDSKNFEWKHYESDATKASTTGLVEIIMHDLKEHGLGESDIYTYSTAIMEAVINVAEHEHHWDKEKKVCINAKYDDNVIMFFVPSKNYSYNRRKTLKKLHEVEESLKDPVKFFAQGTRGRGLYLMVAHSDVVLPIKYGRKHLDMMLVKFKGGYGVN